MFYLARNPKYSYYCSLKIFMRRLVKEHPLEITFSIFALLFASAALIKFEINRRKAAQIAHFYIIICKILKEQVIINFVIALSDENFLESQPSQRSHCSDLYRCQSITRRSIDQTFRKTKISIMVKD